MALSNDTLMNPIFEVYGRIFAHPDGYSGDFVLGFVLWVLPRCETDLWKRFPSVAQDKKKSQMLKSGERAFHLTSLFKETRRAGNFCHSFVIKTQTIGVEVLSCWNRNSPKSAFSSSSSNWGSTFKDILVRWHAQFVYSSQKKKKRPNHPKFGNRTPYGHYWGLKGVTLVNLFCVIFSPVPNILFIYCSAMIIMDLGAIE